MQYRRTARYSEYAPDVCKVPVLILVRKYSMYLLSVCGRISPAYGYTWSARIKSYRYTVHMCCNCKNHKTHTYVYIEKTETPFLVGSRGVSGLKNSEEKHNKMTPLENNRVCVRKTRFSIMKFYSLWIAALLTTICSAQETRPGVGRVTNKVRRDGIVVAKSFCFRARFPLVPCLPTNFIIDFYILSTRSSHYWRQ